jgi:adenylate cyclase
MLTHLCRKPLVEKTRHLHTRGTAYVWEIDEFHGDNAGLIVAEIELEHPDEHFEHPAWLGKEVSHDTRYYNVCLVDHPFKDW